MKLYNVPQRTWVRCTEADHSFDFFFDHVDGMYSFCKDKEGNTCHYQAWMEVEIITEPTYV